MVVSTEAMAERYFACMRARDLDGLAALYAEDAEFSLPDGRSFVGHAAILGMHASVFAAAAPVPTPLHKVVGADSIAVEIEARMADGTSRRTANFYQFNAEGRISRLSVYIKAG